MKNKREVTQATENKQIILVSIVLRFPTLHPYHKPITKTFHKHKIKTMDIKAFQRRD